MNNKQLLWVTIIASSFLLCSFHVTVCQKKKKNNKNQLNTQIDANKSENTFTTTDDNKPAKKKRTSLFGKKNKKNNNNELNTQIDVNNSKNTSTPTDNNKSAKKKRTSLFGGKTIKDMNYEESLAYKEKAIKEKNNEGAITALENALKLCKNITMRTQHTIELADLFFDSGDLLKAELLYTEFSRLYPGSDLIEYALYKAILSSFYATLDIRRDQTKTHETLALTEKFMDRADLFKKYYPDVTKIRSQCQHKIADSEISICNFYIKRGNTSSAQTRLNNIKKDWMPKIPEIEPQLTMLQQKLDNQKKVLQPKTTLVANNKTKKRKNKKNIQENTQNIIVTDASATQKTSFVDKF